MSPFGKIFPEAPKIFTERAFCWFESLSVLLYWLALVVMGYGLLV